MISFSLLFLPRVAGRKPDHEPHAAQVLVEPERALTRCGIDAARTVLNARVIDIIADQIDVGPPPAGLRCWSVALEALQLLFENVLQILNGLAFQPFQPPLG